MPPTARLPLPLAMAAGLTIGLGGPAAALAGTAAAGGTGSPQPAPTAAAITPPTTAGGGRSSTTPSLGEAFGPSTAGQLSLAEHLRARGVIFYGAFWCQHCFHQKVLFGQEAGNLLPYVECAKDEAGARACEAAGVSAYPTWVMGTERLVGVQTLTELAAWSQYAGPSDFGRQTLKKGR